MKSILFAISMCLVSMTVLAKGDEDKPTSVVVENTASESVPVDVQNSLTIDSSTPVVVNQQSFVEYRFVGVTTVETTGEPRVQLQPFGVLIGASAFNKLCIDEYGPGARVSTMSEARLLGDRTTGASGAQPAWVVPSNVAVLENATATSTEYIAYDTPSGEFVGRAESTAAFALGRAACANWAVEVPGLEGPIVAIFGGLGTQPCDREYPVACSAPVALPIYLEP